MSSVYLQARIYHMGIENRITKSSIFQFSKIGSPITQYNLALRYKNGIGVQVDLRRAFNLFHISALKNYAPAQYQLGLAFRNGAGVRENQELARYWFKKASKNRHIGAINIFKKYYSKRFVKQYPSGVFIAMD
jgi:TPR repeat protein